MPDHSPCPLAKRLHGFAPAGDVPGNLNLIRAACTPARTKCEGCWHYSTHVGENSMHRSACERCSAALAQLERRSVAEL